MDLVVAAYSPELRAMPANVVARAIGIGLVAAACGVTRALAELRPHHVLLVGTAGAYRGSGLSIGDVVIGRSSSLACPSFARSAGAFVGESGRAIPLDGAAHEAVGATLATVATTLCITTDDALGSDLAASSEAQVEHLETHAVAYACQAANVPLTVLLGIANHVGARGRVEWLEHRVRVEEAVQQAAARWLALRTPS